MISIKNIFNTIFYQIFFSPQVKGRVIISNKYGMFELPHELLNDLTILTTMFEKRVHQIDSKNEWLLFSVTFTEKHESAFVLTFENDFS